MTEKSRAPAPFPIRQTNLDLSAQQRSLLEMMSEHRFGRVENIMVRDGQPIMDQGVKLVRVARLGGASRGAKDDAVEEFELKCSVRDLFDELARLQNCEIVRLEFRHGLPFLLETASPTQCVAFR